MRRRTITRWPESLPKWIYWPQFETPAAPIPKPKQKPREKAVWRETTDLERRAIEAYKTVSTPWPSYARRLQRTMDANRVTDGIMRWIWHYVHKYRRQIADGDVRREAEKRVQEFPNSA